MKQNEFVLAPLVSVIVPSYNHEKYITQCIESIVKQTYNNIQLIVIDDGSNDSSPELLKVLQKQYDFLLVTQENIGLSATLNKALKKFVTGKYVSICASDDYWVLNKLELQVNFMEQYPNTPMCYGKSYYVIENSDPIKDYDRSNNNLRGGDLFDDILLFKLHPPVNYMLTTTIFNEIGYYNSDIYAEDYYMNLKIAQKFEIGFIDEYLAYYRVDTSFQKIKRFDKVFNSHLKSIEGYRNHPLYSKAKTMVYLRKFSTFAPYKEYKGIAIINSFKSLPFFYKRAFIAGMIKLILFWK